MKNRAALMALAFKLNWAHRSKFLLLTLLVAVGMTVFLMVTELSRVSSVGLDEAIAEDVGETGTYAVEVSSDLGLTIHELAYEVEAALQPFANRPPAMVETLPAVQAECPPYQALGQQQMLVLRESTGDPAALPFGLNLPEESEFCLEGQEVPASALYLPTPGQQRSLGIGIFIDSAYREVVLTATTQPASFRFVVVTKRQVDERDAITRAVQDRLQEHALRHGVVASQHVSVIRLDGAGGIRDASDGIKLVYAIIGWGVLLLGGLGLLVAELIVVRDRTWFFGLARAIGASRRHIAALIFADIGLVLITGTTFALAFAMAIQPVASSFAESTFALQVQLVHTSAVPQLIAGGLLVLILAATYPALRATQQDPLDVLEPKST